MTGNWALARGGLAMGDGDWRLRLQNASLVPRRKLSWEKSTETRWGSADSAGQLRVRESGKTFLRESSAYEVLCISSQFRSDRSQELRERAPPSHSRRSTASRPPQHAAAATGSPRAVVAVVFAPRTSALLHLQRPRRLRRAATAGTTSGPILRLVKIAAALVHRQPPIHRQQARWTSGLTGSPTGRRRRRPPHRPIQEARRDCRPQQAVAAGVPAQEQGLAGLSSPDAPPLPARRRILPP